jgi:hypothetical protein
VKLAAHAAASVPLALAVGLATGSSGYALTAALASVLIDLDHIPDYIYDRGGWRGVRDFFAVCERGEMDTVVLALHGWEWPILLCGGWLAGLLSPWLAAVGLGLGYHLAFDWIGNRPLLAPWFYWIAYRAGKGFAAKKLLCQKNLVVLRGKHG